MSTFVDATSGAVEHCELMAKEHPDLAEKYYDKIASYCKEKLWHQLTLLILDFVSNNNDVRTTPEGTNSYLALYDKVVLSVASKLNPLSLSRIAAFVAASLHQAGKEGSGDGEKDLMAAKAILENLLEKPDETLGTPGRIYIQSKLFLLTLTTMTTAKTDTTSESSIAELNKIKAIIKANSESLKELMAAPTADVDANTDDAILAESGMSIVHSAHYEMSMKYYKIIGPPEAFYEQAMSYLNYTPQKILIEQGGTDFTARELAIDLCLSAFVGDGVYNLGQVVTTPLLHVLKGTDDEWLVKMLTACSKGSVEEFQSLTKQYSTEISKQPTLVTFANSVQEKLTLLALVNYIFEKQSLERTLQFNDIAARLLIPKEQVEWVIMRALSVHLIEGSIDQVDETVTITWVLPRVLDSTQLQDLASRFGTWAMKVSSTKDYMQEQTPTFA